MYTVQYMPWPNNIKQPQNIIRNSYHSLDIYKLHMAALVEGAGGKKGGKKGVVTAPTAPRFGRVKSNLKMVTIQHDIVPRSHYACIVGNIGITKCRKEFSL